MMTLRKNAAGIWSQKHYTNTKNTPLNLLANKYNGDILNTFKYAVGKNGTNKTWANLSNPSTNLTGVTFIKVSKNGNALFVLEKVNNKWRTKNVSNWKTLNASKVPNNAKNASYKYSLKKNDNMTYVALNNLQVKKNTKNIYVKKKNKFVGTIKINNAGTLTFNAAPSAQNTSGLNNELSKLRKMFKSNTSRDPLENMKQQLIVLRGQYRETNKPTIQAQINRINKLQLFNKSIKNMNLTIGNLEKFDPKNTMIGQLKIDIKLAKNQITRLNKEIKNRQPNINNLVKKHTAVEFNFERVQLESRLTMIAMEIGFVNSAKANGYQNKIAKLKLEMKNIQQQLNNLDAN